MKHRALELLACSLIAALTFGAWDMRHNRSSEGTSGTAFVYMTDYMSASIGTYDEGSTTVSVSTLSPVHTDVVLRSGHGRVFVIERFGKDAIVVLDPESPGAPLANYGVGTGSNPQDIVIESLSRAYVIRLAAPNVLVINPMTGDSLDTMDLSAYADADGLPEMVDAELYDGKLYVLLQLLDINNWYAPTGPGKVIELDAATGTIEREITLTIENPAELVVDEGTVYVVGGGYGDTSSGGVDRIEPSATTATRLTDSALLNGRPGSVVLAGGRMWTVVSQEWPLGKVYGVNPQSGAVEDSLTGLVSPSTIATDGSYLLIGDADIDGAGIVVFDATTGALVQAKVETPLPPRSLVFVEDDDATNVLTSKPLPAFVLEQNAPNPFNPSTTIQFEVPEAARVVLAIYDATGRHVRTLVSGSVAAGFHQVAWDGRDESGRAVSSGVYFFRLNQGAQSATRKATLVR